MDTITHGIAGTLLSKALYNGGDLSGPVALSRQRMVTWALLLGAIFPDADTFRDMLSRNEMLMITWHRSLTHSLLCLPIFALVLAALTRWFANWRKWESPSFPALTGIYAIGILSHILLDLVTSFGTMVWSPWRWTRPAWDLIFIIDFTFTGILLLPQILSWVFERPEQSKRRPMISFAVCVATVLAIQALAASVGTPISAVSLSIILLMLAVLFFIPPALESRGFRISRRAWNVGGLAVACCYLALAFVAHQAALNRISQFAAMEKLDVTSLGALPFPPSLWRWDGLVRTPRGVYELRMDLSDHSPFNASAASVDAQSLEYRFYPEARANGFISAARELSDVQKFLWFARFPVTRFHQEDGNPVVEFSDMRFPPIRKNRPASFTYRVRFDPGGHVLEQGWAK